MKTHVAGQTAITSATPTPEQARICGLRSLVMELILSSPFATSEEWDRAAHNVYACTNPATLAKWYANTVRELARREEEAEVPAPVEYATAQQKEHIIRLLNHPKVSRPVKTKVLLNLNRLLPEQALILIAELTDLTTPPPAGGGQAAELRPHDKKGRRRYTLPAELVALSVFQN